MKVAEFHGECAVLARNIPGHRCKPRISRAVLYLVVVFRFVNFNSLLSKLVHLGLRIRKVWLLQRGRVSLHCIDHRHNLLTRQRSRDELNCLKHRGLVDMIWRPFEATQIFMICPPRVTFFNALKHADFPIPNILAELRVELPFEAEGERGRSGGDGDRPSGRPQQQGGRAGEGEQ